MAADKYRPHHPLEYQKLLYWAKGAKSILEIGSRYGYTLADLANQLQIESRVVSVDLPGVGDWGNPGSEESLKSKVDLLKLQGYDAHLFLGDSKDMMIIKSVRALGPYDFIFIDGDHSYEGVKSDWLVYGPMGKVVVFHDIRRPSESENQRLEVWRLWEELRGNDTQEYLAPDSRMGIGRVG